MRQSRTLQCSRCLQLHYRRKRVLFETYFCRRRTCRDRGNLAVCWSHPRQNHLLCAIVWHMRRRRMRPSTWWQLIVLLWHNSSERKDMQQSQRCGVYYSRHSRCLKLPGLGREPVWQQGHDGPLPPKRHLGELNAGVQCERWSLYSNK